MSEKQNMWQVGTFLIFVASLCMLTVSVAGKDFNTRYLEATEGNNLSIYCTASTADNVNVFWSKNDTKSSFIQQGKRLELENIRLDDAGCYICYSLDTTLSEHGTVGNQTLSEHGTVSNQTQSEHGTVGNQTLSEHGTVGNQTLDVVNIVVQDAEQVNSSTMNSRPKEQMETEKPGSDHDSNVPDRGEEKEVDDENDDDDAQNFKTQIIVVVTLGSVGTLIVAVFLVYLFKYKQPRRMIYWLRHFQNTNVTNSQASCE